MSDKPTFHFSDAEAVGRTLAGLLLIACERIEIVGSVRRRKPTVHDVELLYVPKMGTRPIDMFAVESYSLTDARIDLLLKAGVLAKRKNVNGSEVWGERNKLAVHVATGIPVDLFSCPAANWWNSLVCRTGGKESNLLLTTTALRQGWHFEAYGSGFHPIPERAMVASRHDTTSERDVFEFVGLPYLEPQDRP